MINGKLEAGEIYEVLLDEFGAVYLIDEIYNYFGGWGMEDCLRSIASDYDIDLDEEDEEDED